MMTSKWLAVWIGTAIEVTFAWMLFGAGWGPCGPGSPLGFVGLIAHLFPGMLVAGLSEALGAPKEISNIVIIITQLAFWSWLALIIIGINRRKVRIEA